MCHRCRKNRHFSSQWFTKTVSKVATIDPNPGFLDALTKEEGSSWTESINLNGRNITFKLDIGSEVTAISRKTFQKVQRPILERPTRSLYDRPSLQSFKVAGQFSGKMSHRSRSTWQQVFVVENLRTNLLGLPAITALKLATRIQAIMKRKLDVLERFPGIFSGLGNLGQEYEIKLRANARPHSIFTPKQIPLSLRPQVHQELN